MENKINFWIFKFDGYGTVADWVGIIVAIIVIWVTVIHFNRLNKSKLDFDLYLDEDFLYVKINNIGRISNRVKLGGFKSSVIHNYNYAVGQRGAMYRSKYDNNIKNMNNAINNLNEDVNEYSSMYHEVLPFTQSEPIKINKDLLKNAVKVNGQDTHLYIRFVDFSGRVFEKRFDRLLSKNNIRL